MTSPLRGLGVNQLLYFGADKGGRGRGSKNAQNVVVTDILYEWSLMAMMMM